MEAYGQTENLGAVLVSNPFGPAGNCGRPDKDVLVKVMKVQIRIKQLANWVFSFAVIRSR